MYTLRLSPSDVELVAKHVKRGSYDEVAAVLNEIAAQIQAQDFGAQQVELQQAAQAIGEIVAKADAAAAGQPYGALDRTETAEAAE